VTAHAIKAPATLTIGTLVAMAVIGLAALSAVLTVVAARGTCSDAGVEAAPSANARRGIPAAYLSLYRLAARGSGVPWTVLAAIGSIETDHGRSHPGVHSGLNRHGCCAGPMQFNTRDGPPSTWQRYRSDANHDGVRDIHDPEDAIPSAAAYLSALVSRPHGNLDQAISSLPSRAAWSRCRGLPTCCPRRASAFAWVTPRRSTR
jgi:membrane-bound lytic murein transglycosylase B